jgi:hypothetical protein
LNRSAIEFVDQDAIKDGLSHLVVVFGLGLDIVWMSAERFAARTLGDILAVVNLSPKLLLKCYRTNQANPNSFATSELSARWASSLSRVTRIDYRFGGCFLASMPDSFVSSPEKTQIEAIRLFRV